MQEQSQLSSIIYKKKSNPVLITNNDPLFIEGIWKDPQSKVIPPIIFQNGRETEDFLKKFKQPVAGIFFNSSLKDIPVIELIRCCHLYQPAVPIFIIADNKKNKNITFSEKELNLLGIQKILQDPVSFSNIIQQVIQPADAHLSQEVTTKNSTHNDQQLLENDLEFIPIRVDTFMSGCKSFFDLYLRLDSGRYIKISNTGESIQSDRILSFVKKNITHFYIKKESQKKYLDYCEKIISGIIQSENIKIEVKVEKLLQFGESTIAFFKNSGVNEDNIKYGLSFVENVENFLKKNKIESHLTLFKFLSAVAQAEHGSATAFVASLLAKAFKTEELKSVSILGVSALFHDIALLNHSEKIQAEDEYNMTESEKRIYYNHPLESSKVMSSVAGIDPMVLHVIEQHHERVDRSGFPRKTGRGGILLFSELIGLSDEFAQQLRLNQTDKDTNPFVAMLSVYPKFSQPVVKAFQSVFLNRGNS